MAVTLLTGTEQSTDNTSNNPRDVPAKVYELESDVSPLLLLLNKAGSKKATNPKIEYSL